MLTSVTDYRVRRGVTRIRWGTLDGPTMNAELHIHEGPRRGERFPIRAEGIVIGRDPAEGVDVALYDPRVSGRHARIERDTKTGGWILEDLQSTNGTWLGDEQVKGTVTLAPGVRVTFGRVCASTIELGGSALPVSVEPPPSATAPRTLSQPMADVTATGRNQRELVEAVDLLRTRTEDARAFLRQLHDVSTELERAITAPPVEVQRTVRRLVGDGGSLSELERDLAEMLEAFGQAVRYFDDTLSGRR